MQAPFTHYLITRFNIVQSWFQTCTDQFRHSNLQTPEWLEERFRLFETYCLPSVTQQTVTFKWVLLMNSETPQNYKDRIALYQAQYPYITALWLKPYGDENELIRSFVRNDCKTPYVLTTRLDNDDMLHRDFLAIIQNAFAEQENLILNYRTGLQYDTERQVMRLWQYDSNHYLTRIERMSADVQTIIGFDHSMLSGQNFCELATNASSPHWIELVHSCNVANHIQLLRPVRMKTEEFGVELPTPWCPYMWAKIRYIVRARVLPLLQPIGHFPRRVVRYISKRLKKRG